MGFIVSFKHRYICTQLINKSIVYVYLIHVKTAVPKKRHRLQLTVMITKDSRAECTHRPAQWCVNNQHLKRLERGTYSLHLMVFKPKFDAIKFCFRLILYFDTNYGIKSGEPSVSSSPHLVFFVLWLLLAGDKSFLDQSGFSIQSLSTFREGTEPVEEKKKRIDF